MSNISSMFGNVPGMGTTVETFEQAYSWGPYPRYYTGAYIDSGASDPTNSPTFELRMGLVMGRITATGTWTNYNPANTNGSEVAQGILPLGLRMQDVLSGVNTTKFYAMMVSGGVQGSKLIGLDLMSRAQLSPRFIFDDNLLGNTAFPWGRFQTKTANYQIVAADNFSHFDILGAAGEVDFTLPPIANGYSFGFTGGAAQIMKVISFEGGNIISLNSATSTSVAFATGGMQFGGSFHVYSNSAGTKWFVESPSAGTATVTAA
jgi:hypothetical protein